MNRNSFLMEITMSPCSLCEEKDWPPASRGSRISRAGAVEVTLLQVVTALTHWVVAGEAGAPVPYSEDELTLIRKEAQTYLDGVARSLEGKGASIKTRVTVGNAAQEIIKAAEELPASLVMMSTHGRSGFGRWAFGSVTERVLRGGTVPVLLVRTPSPPKPGK